MINDKLANAARREIFNFVEELHGFLHRFVNEPYDQNKNLLVLEEMKGWLEDAWREFDEDFSWDRAKSAIFEASAEQLQAHGLYNRQLSAKLSLFRFRMDRFLNRITKKGLLKVIDAGDTLLDSIISATGLDGALKEIKDLLRNSVDE